jgi:hypothetical protein
MVTAVAGRLKAAGLVAAMGVPFMARCIDLVLFREDEMHAIEFKLSDWRRGIVQARDHLLGADYAYVCLPVRQPSDALIAACEESGVGLLMFDPEGTEPFQQEAPPIRSPEIWGPGRTWLKEAALAGVHEGEQDGSPAV